MSACETFRDRLLDPSDAEATAHRRACASCSAELAALEATLDAVRLSAPSAAEREAAGQIAQGAWSSWRRAALRRYSWHRVSTLALVAAAAGVLVVLPRIPKGPSAPSSPAEAEAIDPVDTTGVAFADESFFDSSDANPEDYSGASDLDGVDSP